MKKTLTTTISQTIILLALLAFLSAGELWAQGTSGGYWTDEGNYSSSVNFSGGQGTEADPYVIGTAQDLARLAYLVNNGTDNENNRMKGKYFVQRADIDLSGYKWMPIGKDGSRTFMGHYAGQGHKIEGMTINETCTTSYPGANGNNSPLPPGYGLFGSVNGIDYASQQPVIQNIVLVNPSITIDCNQNNKLLRIGLLVGSLGNNSTLLNCNVQRGNIKIINHKGLTSGANMFIGGAVGDCTPGFAGYSANSYGVTIKNISVEADITVTPTSATANVGNYQYNAAGIVGRMRYSRGPLVNCYYTGKIDAAQFMVSPSYGAIRNTNSSVTADNYAGKFYDATEKNGTKVYFGDYQVMYEGQYRVITPDGSGGYNFSPAAGSVSTLSKSTPTSTPAGLSVWTFGACSGTFTNNMYKVQGVNSCDNYVSTSTAFSYTNLVDAFNQNINSENIMRYHWSNHEGKLLLERLDEATLTYNAVNNTLTLDFHVPVGATNITYHWRRGAEEVKSGMTDADKTYNLLAKTLTDITWRAYVSYKIGTKTYYSSIPEYVQVASATMPMVELAGERTGNNLALTATLSYPDGLSLETVTYHWTKGGVAQNEITTASTTATAFTPENIMWQVYATFTHEGSEYTTAPATYTQEPPKMTYSVNDDGTNLTFTLGFEDYGGALTDVKYCWVTYNYDADGYQTSENLEETTTKTKSIPAVVFEEKVWHVYVKYRHNSTDYQTESYRYAQEATALPTLIVTKDESSGTQLVMDASLSQTYSGMTNIQYHWSKNGEEQTDHYNAHREVLHTFDTQLWRCWATFHYDSKSYTTTNSETYTYYSTLGQLHFHADLQGDGTINAILDEAGSIASDITIAYSWKDSKNNEGSNASYTNNHDAEWVEFKVTLTNGSDDKLVKYAHYQFDIERRVVYIKYTGGGTDSNDGLTPDTPVATWKKAYSLLGNDGWDKNVIVIINGTGDSRMCINDADTGGKAATITGQWPWVAVGSFAYSDAVGRIYVDAATSEKNCPRIGAPTRFRDVVFYGKETAQNRFNCYLHDAYFDTGVIMRNFNNLTTSEGLVADNKAPQFHLQLYGDQLANDNFLQNADEHMTLTIRSGQFGRILASRIAGTKAKNTYIIGRHDNPLKAVINIEIQDIENNRKAGGTDYTDDIAYLAAGLTQGMIYADIEMNVRKGSITTLVAGSQGNALKMNDLKVPVSTFCGRTTINVMAENDADVVIKNYYGGCQGRVHGDDGICNAYFYGQSTLNLIGGTIQTNVFASSAGISGLRSADPKYLEKGWYTSDMLIPYPGDYAFGVDYLPYDEKKTIIPMTSTFRGNIDLSDTEIVFNISGGRIEGNVYGGSYGYSAPLAARYAPAHAGRLFGNTSVNISGGTIVGSVYGGGEGSADYYTKAGTSEAASRQKSEFIDVAQVYGNTHINITGNPSIAGNIYGGGGGVPAAGAATDETEYRDIAKVFGNTNVIIDADPTWEYRGNIYGGGAMGAVDGTTTVTIKSGVILGNVFGGGQGEEGHADKAKVTGATKVLIGE